ncbi:hypothetical protein VSP10_12470 [Myroides odoratimimus]|uniref:hypothetical protein n=1 Tax=Myroides odoratimimus TaxID=76832 RepID=UPI000245F8EA|nr:hypothetical protein [Myroides odoratimimus]EHO07907.1 hypothetical protein HMPREF9714_02381 [Myroides odoratimimus CCUG 12901]MEC4053601.1 hypothetical protein [Myroides odoratimimus]
MKKKLVITLSLLANIGLYAQTGINTPRPLAVFHVDGKGDNNLTGPLTPAQIANDVVVTAEGNLGIGTINPTNKLVIDNGTGANTGLKLPNGAGAGAVLTANADGSTYWDKSSTQSINFMSVIGSSGFSKGFWGSTTNWKLYEFFTSSYIDNLKPIYGNNYGWDRATHRYIVPKSGKYRVTLTMYFNGAPSPDEWRVIIAKNGEQKPIVGMPYVSVIAQGTDQTGTAIGIIDLNKDDYIQIKVANATDSTRPVMIYGADAHTLLIIESVN